MQKLKDKLPKKEAQIREKAFEKAERLIKNAGITKGIDAPSSVSFRVEGTVKERVDIEVKSGKAFIHPSQKNEDQ